MGYYDVQQVCLNGHQINDSYNTFPAQNKNFCNKCGAETIIGCLGCGETIQGYYHADGIIGGAQAEVPLHCSACGKPFPWTSKIKSEINDITPDQALNTIFVNFHKMARQLRQRHNGRTTIDIKDEYDVQDFLHPLLHMFFSDIRPEEWTPSYAGGSSRMDFLLKEQQTVIEVKMTRTSLKDKEIGDQLIIDIDRYKAHPDCKKLICFVYDPDGYIRNPAGLERDLARVDGPLPVQVIITPQH